MAEIPDEFDPKRLIQNVDAYTGKRLVIRGCNQYWADQLQELGFHSAYMGQEAILD